VDRPHITYAQRHSFSSEAEASTLANIYKFVLDRREKRAVPESRPDAGKELNERSGKSIIPE
jgi:hypothetical protein